MQSHFREWHVTQMHVHALHLVFVCGIGVRTVLLGSYVNANQEVSLRLGATGLVVYTAQVQCG